MEQPQARQDGQAGGGPLRPRPEPRRDGQADRRAKNREREIDCTARPRERPRDDGLLVHQAARHGIPQ